MEDEVDTTVDTGSAATDTGGATDTGATDSAPAFPGADEFGWDAWDGKHDALPEPLRPWAQRLEGHYTKDLKAQQAEVENSRRLYEAMMEGREDPRISEYRSKWETEAQAHQRRQQEHDAHKAEYESYRQRVEKHFEDEAAQEVEAWHQENSWIFDDGEVQQAAQELVTEGFEYEDLPTLLRMPDKMRSQVQKIYKELSADGAKNAGKHAIKLARAEFKLEEPAPAASIVSGSRPPITATPAAGPRGTDGSVSELATHYIRQAMRQRD